MKNNKLMYEYHLELWYWIWDNCQKDVFLKMKTAAIKSFANDNKKAKEEFCTSVASIFLGSSGSIHLPKKILGENVSEEEILDALKDYEDFDESAKRCVDIIWIK